MRGPSAAHWLGTDDLGRDILSRLIWGARISLRSAFEIVGLAAVVRHPARPHRRLLPRRGGRRDHADDGRALLLPPLILALTVAALLGADINDAAIAIAIVFIPGFVRLLRGEVIAVREEAYIESARSLGATSKRLVGRHVLPNVASPIIIQLALSLGFALLAEAGLSFLGVGEQPPTPSWGGMLQEGFQFINSAPVGADLSRARHHAERPGLQPGGRWPAGLVGPGAAGREQPVAGASEGRRFRLGRMARGRPAEAAPPPVDAPSAALLEVEHLRVGIPHPGRMAARHGGRQLLPATGSDARPGR